VDFFIATEGEMKKVNWSTRKEVWGATRVVIVTVMALAIILCIVDTAFMFLFNGIGVLRFDIIRKFFGGGST
jgi:preprotein translocase SecE subunit